VRLFKCDCCGQEMERSVDCTISIKGLNGGVSYHACEDCANEVAVMAAGNDA